MKEYIFPKNNWYIKINNDNRKIVNDWKLKTYYPEDLTKSLHLKYVEHDGCGSQHKQLIDAKNEITTEEFIQYVLKQDVFPKNWAIRQDACQEACNWLNDNFPEYVKKLGEANLNGAWEYITFEGNYSKNITNYIEITKEQFIKHVLQNQNTDECKDIIKFIKQFKK